MPPKKRTACNPRRPRLLFLESPQDGPVHEYGAAPPKAERTRCVPTKPLDHDSSTSWVSPQFDQAQQLHFPQRRRRRNVSDNSTAHGRNGDGNQSQLRAPGRKPSVCKFPPLSFSAAENVETQSFSSTRRRTKRHVPMAVPLPMAVSVPMAVPLPMAVPSSPPAPEGHTCSRIPSPPDIRTPETSPRQTSLLLPCAAGMQTPLFRTRADAPHTPPAAGPVLAEDTPEHEYGVRLTWRRRQGLMKFLKSRGRLRSSQILVKP